MSNAMIFEGFAFQPIAEQSSATQPLAAELLDVTVDRLQEGGLSNVGKRVLVIGIGNGGCRAIDYLHHQNLQHARLLKIDMDEDSLCDKIDYLLLSVDGNGAGMNPDIAITRVHELQDEIHRELETADVIFLLASLGGGTGSGALPELAALAKNMNKHVIIIANTPELYQGQQETAKANQSLQRIEEEDLANALMVIPNDRLMEMGDDLDEDSTYEMSYQVMYEAVRSLETLTNKQISRKIDFNDLGTILKHRGRALFATEKVQKEAGQAIQEAFSTFAMNSLADIGSVKSVKGILVNLRLPKPLLNSQKRWVAEKIGDLCPQGDQKWNSIVDSNLAENEVVLTVVATGIECDNLIQPESDQNSAEVVDMMKLREGGGNKHNQGQEAPQPGLELSPQWGLAAAPNPMLFNGPSDMPAFLKRGRN